MRVWSASKAAHSSPSTCVVDHAQTEVSFCESSTPGTSRADQPADTVARGHSTKSLRDSPRAGTRGERRRALTSFPAGAVSGRDADPPAYNFRTIQICPKDAPGVFAQHVRTGVMVVAPQTR